MVKKRLIACLDVAAGRVVKGVRFERLRDIGDPVELAERYSEVGVDELVFLDITASVEGRRPLLALVERAAESLTIPFTVGGGISGLEDARALLQAGADKVAVNRAAFDDPTLLTTLADEFGSQAVVCAIATSVEVPVIASGGAGESRHLADAFAAGAEAALVASIVHERPERVPELKAELRQAGWNLRS